MKEMPFTPNNNVMPVLPKPDHATGGIVDSNTPLSAVEDKELRKKLRNRQSALAARERKKARMLELERQVAELQEMNRRTEDENQYLRARLEVMARKCVRAGMRLEGEKDFIRSYNFSDQQPPQQQALRVAGIPDYSNAYRVNQQGPQYPVQRECTPTYPMEKPYHHQSEGNIHQAASEGANGVSPTEANLRNAIKVLGARQHEILQSMSYNGMQGRQVASPAVEANVHAVAVKQEYVEQQPSPHCHNGVQNYSHCNQLPENAAIAMERSREASGRIPQRGAAHKRSMTDLRRQALPSIGAMLGSPAKRQCTQQSPSFTHQYQEAASPLPARPVSSDNHTNKPENQLPAVSYDFDLCQSQQQVSVRSAPELHGSNVDLRDCNLNSASSPMMLNAGDCLSDEFYGAPDDKLPILDFQDFIGGDLSADSPSGLSGSDSGVSMDDSLDWITENPIFDL